MNLTLRLLPRSLILLFVGLYLLPPPEKTQAASPAPSPALPSLGKIKLPSPTRLSLLISNPPHPTTAASRLVPKNTEVDVIRIFLPYLEIRQNQATAILPASHTDFFQRREEKEQQNSQIKNLLLQESLSPHIPVEPPAVEPPAVEPPAVEPPAVEPPAVEPPAVEPTSTSFKDPSPSLQDLFGKDLRDAYGRKVKLSSLKGKIIGVYFSARWCAPCRIVTPQLVAARDANKDRFEIVFVSNDRSEAERRKYMQTSHMRWPTLPLEGEKSRELRRIFNTQGIPALGLIDAQGQILQSQLGDNNKRVWEFIKDPQEALRRLDPSAPSAQK